MAAQMRFTRVNYARLLQIITNLGQLLVVGDVLNSNAAEVATNKHCTLHLILGSGQQSPEFFRTRSPGWGFKLEDDLGILDAKR